MTQVGKYTLVKRLAVGGMAEVFLAHAAGPRGFKKTLVLKRILPAMAQDPMFVEMFLAEAKLAAQLNHPNIVQIFDFGEAEGSYYIAMEYIDGPNLRILARRARELGTPLPFSLCAKIVSLACDGLAYAHDFADPESGQPLNLIHRDISPDNVLLSRQGGVKVVDFGIAKAAGQTAHTKTGTLKGKLSYMPPEQLHGMPLDRRADLYSLGIVLYELVTGSKPFDATSDVSMMKAILQEEMIPANQRRSDVPPPLMEILAKALAKRRDLRHANCLELQADLERYLIATREPTGASQLAALVARLTPAQPATQPPPLPEAEASTTEPAPSGMTDVSIVEVPADEPATAQAAPVPLTVRKPTKRRSLLAPVGLVMLAAAAGGGVILIRIKANALPPPPPPELAHPTPVIAEPELPRAEAPPTPPHPPSARPTAQVVPVKVRPVPTIESRPHVIVAQVDPPPPPPPAPPPAAHALASFQIETSPPAQVRVNGRFVCAAPCTVRNQAPGDVRVEAYDSNLGFSKTASFSLAAGDNGVKRLVIEQGRIELRIRPYAAVILDGRPLGQTPLDPVTAYEGKHTVRLVNNDLGKDASVVVLVKPGETSLVKYNFAE